MLRSEASLIEGPSAAAGAGTWPMPTPSANSTEWLGCLVGAIPTLVGGAIVRTLSGLASAEACCRACRTDARCNVWNFCSRPEGCSFEDLSTKVSLAAQQCELRRQLFVDPATGGPPILIAKGQGAGGFTAGAPMYVHAGPELPGFTCIVGGGLFGQPGYVCEGSVR